MAISVAARKAKGRKGQQKLASALLDAFPTLTPDDIRSCSMGSNGADVLLSAEAKRLIPYEFEVKVRASGFTPVYDALEQAGTHGDLTPVACIIQDRRKPLVVMTLEDWIGLVSR